MELSDLEVYSISMTLSNKIWSLVQGWHIFEKDTIGKQIVRASDSISANISEGFGRYYFKDSKVFLFYARGSLFETRTFVNQAHSRKLISDESNADLNEKIILLLKKLNSFINSINSKLKQ